MEMTNVEKEAAPTYNSALELDADSFAARMQSRLKNVRVMLHGEEPAAETISVRQNSGRELA